MGNWSLKLNLIKAQNININLHAPDAVPEISYEKGIPLLVYIHFKDTIERLDN